ncbi:hypothetical protein [Planococcus sp. YIM B11945]|uniref:hypothetical protein n=1 Tax=Planococcus sp. YIM B11945 TaxID=3435410 RepID=UPI003D7F016F
MKNFSFKGRIIYFSLIAAVSLAFFALQWYANSQEAAGSGSVLLLVIWGLLVAFGIGGVIYSISKRGRHKK